MEVRTLNRTFAQLKAEIEAVEDTQHREISRAMALLMSTLEVGTDADRLIKYTGFSPDFVRNIRDCMTAAGLWTADVVNDEEWWDGDELNQFVLFVHAHVALGLLSRRQTSSTIEYVDKRTGKIVANSRRQVQ